MVYHGKLVINPTPHGIELHWLGRVLSRGSFSPPLLRFLKQHGHTVEKVDRRLGRRLVPVRIEGGDYLLATLPAADYVVEHRDIKGRKDAGAELFRLGGPRW
jgi:hypothetical protein